MPTSRLNIDDVPEDDGPMLERLCLHTDAAGNVWYGHDNFLGTDSGIKAAAFVEDVSNTGLHLSQVRSVRVLGVQANSRLLVDLYALKAKKRLLALDAPIWVAGPLACATHDDPLAVVQQLRSPDVCQRLTGMWHRLDAKGCGTFAMRLELAESGGVVTERARRILRHHPAWPALSFVRSLNVDSAVKLICLMGDPRWYRSPDRPSRCNRLFSYLGLSYENVSAHTCGLPGGLYADRLGLVLHTLFSGGVSASPDDPRSFVVRVLHGHKHTPAAYKLATRLFIRFVCLVWEASLASHPEVVFIPSKFFKHPYEIAAYTEHVNSLAV